MSRHVFEQEQFLPISINKAWDFFSDPRNLAHITPPSFDFRLLSVVPEKVSEGLSIEYRIKPLLGIPIKWVSLIKDVKAPYEFVDIQKNGPYRYWHHRHHFQEASGGVIMKDIIHYELPLEWLLPWVNQVVVVKQLKLIFGYRYKTISALFPVPS